MIREIIKINEQLCDGCGLCIPSCKEGALQIIDGKARLISELLCDGLGACIGECPNGAITIEKREAEPYDEIKVIKIMIEKGKNTVIAHLKHLLEHQQVEYYNQAINFLRENRQTINFDIEEIENLILREEEHKSSFCGCPGSQSREFSRDNNSLLDKTIPSELTHWPIQLHLINPYANFFIRSDLLIAADCTAFTFASFHTHLLKGKKLVIGCPKLDDGLDVYIEKVRLLIDEANINIITVVIMEVPCCSGLYQIVEKARQMSQKNIPIKLIILSVEGEILQEKWS